MKTNIYSLLLILVLFSCNTKSEQITSSEDYNAYLESKNESFENANKNFNFWTKKLEETPNQYPYLAKIAGSQSQIFSTTGRIENLIAAEKNLVQLNEKTNFNKAGYLRALARNYISQHRFKDALVLLEKAETNGESLNGTHKMLFDVYMELGNDEKAKYYLEQIVDLKNFDYLIRTAKWNDHKGDLSAAIKYMEKAVEKAESSNSKDLKQWAYTNIADFYGHNGQIEKSYNYFLKSLELNPDDAYAKKGIAWIVYSYEHNPKEALRILDAITTDYNAPDYYLLKAEISEYMNDDKAKTNYLASYKKAVNNKSYGEMYNAYNVELWAEDETNIDAALAVSKREIKNRATAHSYDLLAWSHLKNGDREKALKIVEDHVEGKTFEPKALYHLAEIYKANGETNKAKFLKEELLESAFELGPIAAIKIEQI